MQFRIKLKNRYPGIESRILQTAKKLKLYDINKTGREQNEYFLLFRHLCKTPGADIKSGEHFLPATAGEYRQIRDEIKQIRSEYFPTNN